MATVSTNFQNISQLVSDYGVEDYTGHARVAGTGIVDMESVIRDGTGNDEGMLVKARYIQDGDVNINIVDESDDDVVITDLSSAAMTAVKTHRSVSFKEQLGQRIKSKVNPIGYFGARLAKGMADDMENALYAQLAGVLASEIKKGEAQQTTNYVKTGGNWTDLNNTNVQTFTGDSSGKLINSGGTNRDDKLANLIGVRRLAFKDRVQNYPVLYLLTDANTAHEAEKANIVDERNLSENNLQISSLLGGQIWMIVSNKATQNFKGAAARVNSASTKTSYLIAPGAFKYESIAIGDVYTNATMAQPVTNFYEDPRKGKGGGILQMVSQFGYILHPDGWSWTNASTTSPMDTPDQGATTADPRSAAKGLNSYFNNFAWTGTGNVVAPTTAAALLSSWERKYDISNLGIFGITHS